MPHVEIAEVGIKVDAGFKLGWWGRKIFQFTNKIDRNYKLVISHNQLSVNSRSPTRSLKCSPKVRVFEDCAQC